MTTGRINQVTTDRIGAAAGGLPPNTAREGRGLESRDRGAPGRSRPVPARCAGRRSGADHPCAPTEFLRETSAAVVPLGPEGRPTPWHQNPREEVTHRPTRPEAATGGGFPPMIQRGGSDKPSTHRSNWCPAAGLPGLLFPQEAAGRPAGCRPWGGWQESCAPGVRHTTSRGLKALRRHNRAIKRPERSSVSFLSPLGPWTLQLPSSHIPWDPVCTRSRRFRVRVSEKVFQVPDLYGKMAESVQM